MANWPNDLPQEWFDPDAPPTYDPVDNTIRTSVTSGPAKLRRRFTAQTEDVVLNNTLCEEELTLLENFVKITLGEVGKFYWKNFRNGSSCQYRFKAGWSSVKSVYLAGDLWRVTLTLELMP